MLDLLKELYPLKRDLISDGYDRALSRLAEIVPMTIHEYPTGEECWTWRVPEKWTCDEAYLQTVKGERLVNYAKHPLSVVSYSLPFDGWVSRDELLKHLHYSKDDSIPFVFKYYERDWGLCCPWSTWWNLNDDTYRVVIRSRFEPGTLKVGEIVIQSKSDKTAVIIAHLCHPAQANDDLSGVVVALEAAQHLWGTQPNYTYRFLFVPETIGSAAYLSHHEDLIPDMVGGFALDMLGNNSPHALQSSFQPDSQFDKCMATAFVGLDPQGYIGAYRTVVQNDERQFNAPGVRVPMLSLSRVEPPSSPTRPYREYHSSLDTPAIITEDRLQASLDMVMGLIDAWEHNYIVYNNFKGEVFCSRFGIWIDYRTDPEGHRLLFSVMDYCDGKHSVADIATELHASFQGVWRIVSLLREKGLVSLV